MAFVSLGFVSVFSDTDAPKAMAAVHMSRRTQRKNEEWNTGFFDGYATGLKSC
jgi:hypothetical protein